MRLGVRLIGWFTFLFILLPVSIGAGKAYLRGWPENWRSASWNSAGLLPEAATAPGARLLILSARTGNWKSIFAEHLSIVLKREGDPAWTRYDVVGWGAPVRRNAFHADAYWYGNRPYIVADIRDAEAALLIPRVEAAIARYPYAAPGIYAPWPGPNSNSFVAWVVRNTEGFAVELPPVAVGKDYFATGVGLAAAPSRTGFTAVAWGLFGVTFALDEGIEFHIAGSTVGFDPLELALKLPSLGKISLLDMPN
jgi:hypothetical protein